MSEYTTRKLRVGNFESIKSGYSIYFDSDYLPASIVANTMADNPRDLSYAHELVRRWNSHKGLLEACKAALEYLNSSSKFDWDNILTPQLEAAIAEMEKEGAE